MAMEPLPLGFGDAMDAALFSSLWTFQDQGAVQPQQTAEEELKQSLLTATAELEATKEELRRKDQAIAKLADLVRQVAKERDEALDKAQHLALLAKQQQAAAAAAHAHTQTPQAPALVTSSVTDSDCSLVSSPVDPFFDPVTSSNRGSLRRTGKSCRLRWVNYLHPGLKRGRITADEERLILSLHAQWGSRWSRIARKLPGRTDNEIKNYWRTHMRKMAQEEKTKKKATTPASSSTTSGTTCSASATVTSSSAATTTEALEESASMDDDEAEGEATTSASASEDKKEVRSYCAALEMDQLWNDIAATEIYPEMMMSWGGGHVAVAVPVVEPPSSPAWEFCSDYPLWRIHDEEYYNTISQHALN